jgi:uncharacterized protein YdeI (YjbR/CyaY-like superfamily)
MEIYRDVKTHYAKDAASWRDWLAKNHQQEASVWLIIYHKEAEKASVYYDEAVEEALCYGWVDSKPNKRDDESYYLFFARRNPKSNWSKINKDRVDKLIAENRMEAAGLALVEEAKLNGGWSALDEVENLVIPKDLAKAFADFSGSEEKFLSFPRSVKKGILEWILNAKRPETRKKRIDETARLAQQGVRANQYQRKG